MVSKHKHIWHLLKSKYYDEWDSITSKAFNLNKILPIERGDYVIFVCDCGLIKEVKVKYEK